MSKQGLQRFVSGMFGFLIGLRSYFQERKKSEFFCNRSSVQNGTRALSVVFGSKAFRSVCSAESSMKFLVQVGLTVQACLQEFQVQLLIFKFDSLSRLVCSSADLHINAHRLPLISTGSSFGGKRSTFDSKVLRFFQT